MQYVIARHTSQWCYCDKHSSRKWVVQEAVIIAQERFKTYFNAIKFMVTLVIISSPIANAIMQAIAHDSTISATTLRKMTYKTLHFSFKL